MYMYFCTVHYTYVYNQKKTPRANLGKFEGMISFLYRDLGA